MHCLLCDHERVFYVGGRALSINDLIPREFLIILHIFFVFWLSLCTF